MPDRDWWRVLWPNPDDVVQALGIKPSTRVLDLGCGDGYFTAAIARQAHSGRVIGLDLDLAMLSRARAACRGLANCEWLEGDARELPRLLAEPVDYVLIANTFHGVPNQTALARAVAAVLEPGGRLGIINWHPIPREQTPVLGQPRGPRTELRMSPEQAHVVVQPAGFEWERLVQLPPYHYAVIFLNNHRTEDQASHQSP